MLDKMLKTIVGSIILFGGITIFVYFPQIFDVIAGLVVLCLSLVSGYIVGDLFFKHIMGE